MANTSESQLPFVSVIIPVHNDQENLRLCLSELEGQSYPAERSEFIVVDNNSDAPLDNVAKEFPDVVFISETRPGSYAARNAGIARAKGEVLAFLDSDCRPEEDWLEHGVRALMVEENIGVVGGRMKVVPADPDSPTGVELYEMAVAFPQRRYVHKENFSITANLFTTAEVIETVGGFDESTKSGGDREWGQRVFAHGYAVVYADDAVVRHPARRTFEQLRTKVYRTTAGRHSLGWSGKVGLVTRLKRFIYLLLRLWPPLITIWRILTCSRLGKIGNRIRAAGVGLRLQYVSVLESWRLYFGGAYRW